MLREKEEGNFVERADLVVPLNEGPARWVVWELETPGYPIGRLAVRALDNFRCVLYSKAYIYGDLKWMQ